MTKYLIDTNVLITAYRSTYPMDVFEAFWENILKYFKTGEILLIDMVYNEIVAGDDFLKEWIEENKDSITILSSDESLVIEEYSNVIQVVMDESNYSVSAKEDFADIADSWLIAHAKCNGYTIVTEETYQSSIHRKVKIPNECIRHDINFIKTIDLLRVLKIKI